MNILAATDLSARSDRAIDRAVSLSNQLDAPLHILHVVDDELPASIANQNRSEAEKLIDAHISSLPKVGRHKPTRSVVFGRADSRIVEEAEAADVGLIVLGTHREHALADMFVGTTAERVIRRAERPILVVKERPHTEYLRIMVALDFSICSRRALETALRLFPAAMFHLLHAYDLPFKGFMGSADPGGEISKRHHSDIQRLIAEESAAFLAGLSQTRPMPPILVLGSPIEAISAEFERLGPDLLVLGTHGRTGVAHALLGSVAEYFLANPRWDVLAVKAW